MDKDDVDCDSAIPHCYAVGDRVRMLKTITAGPAEDLPAQHFCDEGEVLIVRKVTSEKRPRNGVWPIYVSHANITDRSFGVMFSEIEAVCGEPLEPKEKA